MKSSKQYAEKVRKLYQSLRGKNVKQIAYEEPTDSLVYAIVSENISQSAAQTSVRKLTSYFVDWNDLRVSRAEEVLEVLGKDCAMTRTMVATLSTALQYIFHKNNTVTLTALMEMGKRPARLVLEKIEGLSQFVIDYVMLTSLHAHAIPLTARMLEFLRRNGLVHPGADERAIQGFLERQVSATQGYDFYYLLRRASEKKSSRPRKKPSVMSTDKKEGKKKSKTRPRTRKKTKAKSKAKKARKRKR